MLFSDIKVVSLDFKNLHLHPGQLIDEIETSYSHLDVIDNSGSINNIVLVVNGYPHSIMDKAIDIRWKVIIRNFFHLDCY